MPATWIFLENNLLARVEATMSSDSTTTKSRDPITEKSIYISVEKSSLVWSGNDEGAIYPIRWFCMIGSGFQGPTLTLSSSPRHRLITERYKRASEAANKRSRREKFLARALSLSLVCLSCSCEKTDRSLVNKRRTTSNLPCHDNFPREPRSQSDTLLRDAFFCSAKRKLLCPVSWSLPTGNSLAIVSSFGDSNLQRRRDASHDLLNHAPPFANLLLSPAVFSQRGIPRVPDTRIAARNIGDTCELDHREQPQKPAKIRKPASFGCERFPRAARGKSNKSTTAGCNCSETNRPFPRACWFPPPLDDGTIVQMTWSQAAWREDRLFTLLRQSTTEEASQRSPDYTRYEGDPMGRPGGTRFMAAFIGGVFLPPGAKVCQVPDPIKNFTLALRCSINKLSCFENATRQAEKLTFSFSRLIQNARKKGILPERILRQRTQLAPSGVCAGSSWTWLT